MKTICTVALAASALALAACSDGGGYYTTAAIGNTYYDDFYGPFNAGYWGLDGAFYYRDGHRRARFLRDDGYHFRRDAADGFHRVPGRFQGGFSMRHRDRVAAPTPAPANPNPSRAPQQNTMPRQNKPS